MGVDLVSRGSTASIHRVSECYGIFAEKRFDSRTLRGNATPVDVLYRREISAMKAVSHRNVVAFVASEQISPSEFSITMTYCDGGSLFARLYAANTPALTNKQVLKILSDTFAAITCIHSLPDPLIHGDIKSLNLLLMAPVNRAEVVPWIKLCDFGSSRFRSEPPTFGSTTVGTTQWMAPEVLAGEDCDTSADIYSLGMVVYETCFSKVPFDNVPPNDLMKNILRGDRPSLLDSEIRFAEAVKPELKSFLAALWSHKPSDRPSAEEATHRLNQFTLSCSITS